MYGLDPARYEAVAAAPAPTSSSQAPEPLACVTCRSRKLKCDRTRPSCSRCAKATDGTACVYPEPRRRTIAKRRNVEQLEARLAQVEGFLKDSRDIDRKRTADVFDLNAFGRFKDASGSGHKPIGSGVVNDGVFATTVPRRESNEDEAACFTAGLITYGGPSELVDMHMSEPAPSFEMVEALNMAYFDNQQMFIPIVHPGRFFRAFLSGPHLRPPMCLQYSMWALAAQNHPVFDAYHDVFYRRARQYLQDDEMKNRGESFITVAHAQAWALIATYEAQRMLFSRAAMSCSRCVRLTGMLGLNRLDDEDAADRSSPAILPPTDWAELEERRRVFWGAFSIDSHASLSTGWPSFVDPDDITTRLPSSEDAFQHGREEASCMLSEVFSGVPYSTFSTSIVVCHLFNSIMRHRRQHPRDRPGDVENGPFWKRHRDIDTKLSSAFVVLPERYRLPQNRSNPIAIQTNLNLHAAIICLHNAALERAVDFSLPDSVKKTCLDRLMTAAQAIVNIVELSGDLSNSFKSPITALSIYCTTAVYVYQAMEHEQRRLGRESPGAGAPADLGPFDSTKLEFIMKRMESSGRTVHVNKILLSQTVLDIESNGLAEAPGFSFFAKYRGIKQQFGHDIPILARSIVTRRSKMQQSLHSKLPLSKNGGATTNAASGGDVTNKRRRMQSPVAVNGNPSPAISLPHRSASSAASAALAPAPTSNGSHGGSASLPVFHMGQASTFSLSPLQQHVDGSALPDMDAVSSSWDASTINLANEFLSNGGFGSSSSSVVVPGGSMLAEQPREQPANDAFRTGPSFLFAQLAPPEAATERPVARTASPVTRAAKANATVATSTSTSTTAAEEEKTVPFEDPLSVSLGVGVPDDLDPWSFLQSPSAWGVVDD